jgi:hypothetical protein
MFLFDSKYIDRDNSMVIDDPRADPKWADNWLVKVICAQTTAPAASAPAAPAAGAAAASAPAAPAAVAAPAAGAATPATLPTSEMPIAAGSLPWPPRGGYGAAQASLRQNKSLRMRKPAATSKPQQQTPILTVAPAHAPPTAIQQGARMLPLPMVPQLQPILNSRGSPLRAAASASMRASAEIAADPVGLALRQDEERQVSESLQQTHSRHRSGATHPELLPVPQHIRIGRSSRLSDQQADSVLGEDEYIDVDQFEPDANADR